MHIIPARRCDIDWAYCNDYDQVSQPIPLDTMTARIDKLAALGTSVVAMSKGKPMLHPDLDEIIGKLRRRGMITGLITNGYRAGTRYLYICEDGIVHYCSQQRGAPGIPLVDNSVDDIKREFLTPKSCAPYSTIGCVHRVSTMDYWRKPQAGRAYIYTGRSAERAS